MLIVPGKFTPLTLIRLLLLLVISCSGDREYDPSLKDEPCLIAHQLKNGQVLFSFRNFFGPIKTVQVAGDFSYNSKPAGPFQLKDINGDGVFRCATDLDPGIYMYRFIINANIIVDPIEMHDFAFAGSAGGLQVKHENQPRILKTTPDKYSLIDEKDRSFHFRMGGNTDGFIPRTLTVYINGKEYKPEYDHSSGKGKLTIPNTRDNAITFAFRAQTASGMEALNDRVTLYKKPKRKRAMLPASITSYRILVPYFGTETEAGKAGLKAVIDRLDYLNNGKEDSLGIKLLFLHALYPVADPHCQAALSYTGFRRGVYRGLLHRLTAECRKRGIKTVLHYNAGYCSNKHPWFQEAYGNLTSNKMRWFRFQNSRHTRYAGFMRLKAYPILRIDDNEIAQAFFLNNILDWIKTGVDGLFLENADLQDDRFWSERVRPFISRYRKPFLIIRNARREAGRIAYLNSSPANLVSFSHYPRQLQLALATKEIRNIPELLTTFMENSPDTVFLRPTSTAGEKRPGSLFRKNSSRAAYIGNMLIGSGIPVIRFGDELGAVSPPYPESRNPARMPWSSLATQSKLPVSLFNLTRLLIKLRGKNPELQRDRLAGKKTVFYDSEKDEPQTTAIRWAGGDSFYFFITNPEGFNTRISRELKVKGLPDGNYLGKDLLQQGQPEVEAEAEDGQVSISDCPTGGLGFLIYRFQRK